MRASRLGDMCTGHGAYPPRASTGGSSDVFINGIPAHRVGDSWTTHCDPSGCHGGTTSGGSSTVYINGKAAARVGDSVDCGSGIAEGSNDVYIG